MRQDNLKPRQRKRYEFIEFQLMWEGAIGRKLLQQKFEISPQQATLDLTSYLDKAPMNMSYDPRQRTYVSNPAFKPMFVKGEASEYLIHLEMLRNGHRDRDEVWPASIPQFDAVATVSRKIDSKVLKVVLLAIRDRVAVKATYVSLSSYSESSRVLFPHAIASDGHRLHMRAYDGDKDRFSDFVFSRIKKIELCDADVDRVPSDEKWNSFIELRLQPDPKLSGPQKEGIRIEYEMTGGAMKIVVRKAMVFYILRFYGFDPHETKDGIIRNKSSFPLSIVNTEEVDECIERRR